MEPGPATPDTQLSHRPCRNSPKGSCYLRLHTKGGVMSIYELVNEIDNDDIVLPAIQRDFVWDEARIELLLDSMFRGYPVGIVLLWETYTPIQYRAFA
jgi:hypothetical protein